MWAGRTVIHAQPVLYEASPGSAKNWRYHRDWEKSLPAGTHALVGDRRVTVWNVSFSRDSSALGEDT